MTLTKQHWIESKVANEQLILKHELQTKMAREMIKLCDREIAKFPETLIEKVNKKVRRLLKKKPLNKSGS